MNRKELILLLLGVIAIGGTSIGVFKRNASSWHEAAPTPTGKVLKEFALNDVARIQIKSNQSDLNLIKKDGQWTLKERGDYPANFEQIGDLVRKIWELKAVQTVKAGPSQLGRLNLNEQGSASPSAGTLVDLKDQSGTRISALLVGKPYLRGDGGMEEGGGYPAGRYVVALDADRQALLVSEPFTQVDSPAAQWLDHAFFKIDHIKSAVVTGTSPEAGWKLSRENETANWKLEDAKPGEELDQAKVPAFVSQLGFPGFIDVAPRDSAGKTPVLEKPAAMTVETFDGFLYTIKLGSPVGENCPLTVSVSANLPKKRVAGKEEKPADKTRLDAEFAAKAKELQAKLEKEKKFEKETYLVAKSGFDSMLKQRSELMAEKKPAPTPSPSPAEKAK